MAVAAVMALSAVTNAQDLVVGDTIQISSFEDLCKIGVDEGYPLGGDYRLVADIDASGSRDSGDGAGFLPIGVRRVLVPSTGFGVPDVVDSAMAFTGTFNGGGHTIRGLYIKRTAPDATGSGSNIGLFGFAVGAHIMNVTVVADTVAGYRYVGALVGRLSGGVVERSVSYGVVAGQADVGGLVGMLEEGGAVKVCYSAADVGGESVNDIGGLVGINDAVVSESYSIGRVSVGGGNRVGGLAGSLTDRARVLSCYSMAEVSGGDAAAVGGLVGNVDDGGEVRRSYAAGAVSGDGAGGLIGDGGAAALYSSWDKERSGCETSAGGSGAVGRTTAQMMSASVMNTLVAADAAAWGISNNYPYLKNEFFPKRAITVTASRGGALSGDTTEGGTVHTQRVNHWIEGKTVVAMPSPDSIVGGFDGWYVAGSDTALDVGEYDGYGFSVGKASADSTTGEFLISSLTADSVAIDARFIIKKHKLTYIAINGRGTVVSQDDNEGTRTADTLVKFVEHGTVSSVTAEPHTGYRFLQWWADQNNKSIKEPARADTALKDFEYRVSFADSTIEMTYNAGPGGRLRVNESTSLVTTHTAKPQYGTPGPSVLAEPNNANYRFVMWDDSVMTNPRIDSAVVSFVVTAIFDTIPVSVKSPNRIIPNAQLTNVTTQIQPVKAISGSVTAGPNPVLRQSGIVNFYRQGSKITAGTLLIFDANGNFVNKIIVNDNNGGINKRTMATWTLTDAKGKQVNAGTYLIRGTLSTKTGRYENVVLILQLI
ncbi:MAG: hypothetical protein LBC59_06970 [Chitinispirillales bacterium]|jgi:hypothetical protein|nr:hypothetical protein [Chitinispirillales bacterium]